MSDQVRILIVEDMRADEALKVLDEGQTDLAILDIHIKGARSGIWLAEQIRERYHIPFIFLTAFGDKQTIADAARTQPPKPPTELPVEQPKRLLISDSIFVKDDLIYRRISVSEIQFVQSFRNYIEISTGQGKKYLLRSTLKEFLSQLPPTEFIQTHRSYAVNISLVNRIGGNFVGVGDTEVPMSREVRNEVVSRLNTYQWSSQMSSSIHLEKALG